MQNSKVDPCGKACEKGIPGRAYVCQCTKCGGLNHGAETITEKYFFELFDRKLRDQTISPHEFRKYLKVAKVMHDEFAKPYLTVVRKRKARDKRRRAA